MGGYVFRALALAAALFAAPVAAAQTISAPLQVRTGDVFTVAVDYSQQAELQEQEFSATISQVYSVHVIDAEARLWRFMPVSISYQMPEMPGIDPQALNINWLAMSDLMSAMLRIGTDVGFECRVNEYGRCIEMTNWPFWSARVENLALAFDAAARMMPAAAPTPIILEEPVEEETARPTKGEVAEIVPETVAPPVPGPSWETLRGPVMQGVARLIDGFDSRDAASSMAGLYLPAFIQGRTLTRRQNQAFVDEYDMPFGAPPLRYNGTLRLERIDRRANTATITRRSQLDQESARAAMTAMTQFVSDAVIEPLAPHFPEGQQPPSGTALSDMLNAMLANLGYEETTRGVIDLTTGMARETTTDFTVTARMTGVDEPVQVRGRIVTRVAPSAPNTPRLPRG